MKFERLFIRHWDRWYEGKRNHIFVVPIRRAKGGKRWVDRGRPIDVMEGMDGDCPTRPLGKREDYAWSQDGKELAFTAQTGLDEAWSTDVDIYLVPAGGGRPRCITADNRATASHPTYSPDGKSLAYLSMMRPGFESDRRRINIYDRETGDTRTLTEDWDRSPESITWSTDSEFLLAQVPDTARHKVIKVDVKEGRPTVIVSDHHNFRIATAGENRIFYLQDSLVAPADVWSTDLDGLKALRLTHSNDEKMSKVLVSEPEEFYFAGAAGDRVHSWVVKPVGFVPGKKYPVAFIIHGGPQGATEDTFHHRWNLQVFAGAGYGVVAVNFHGSIGFGQAFTDAITRDWGGKPFEDLMLGLDHALATYDWLDDKRVAALGPSFGGWMVNWINGHTDRFKCLVNHDGEFDSYASYFSTDELWFPEWEFGGTPWEKPELYEKFSPDRYVANWKTPTLVIHGGRDYRLVDTDGISTFTALQRRGIPSQLLYFKDEGHWVEEPRNSIVWHETILNWLRRWLQ
jgi:dipeptidyl aminopeptidase/acylaminoacyl peptidase